MANGASAWTRGRENCRCTQLTVRKTVALYDAGLGTGQFVARPAADRGPGRLPARPSWTGRDGGRVADNRSR